MSQLTFCIWWNFKEVDFNAGEEMDVLTSRGQAGKEQTHPIPSSLVFIKAYAGDQHQQ